MAVETPKYVVLKTSGEFEVRRYGPTVVAETIVDGAFESASSLGFRSLAGYIFGANQSKSKIAMTAPVDQQARGGGKYLIAFTMPGKFTMETLPTPDNKNVVLKKVEEKVYATIRFSGTWSESDYIKYLNSLNKWIEKEKYEGIGEPIFARYNPPWTLWFLRRNEILIEIKTPEKS